MAKNIYVGNNETASKVKKMYVGVNGVAREVQKAYVGVNGIARLCWQKQDVWQRYSVVSQTVYEEEEKTDVYFLPLTSRGQTAYAAMAHSYTFNRNTGIFTLSNVIDEGSKYVASTPYPLIPSDGYYDENSTYPMYMLLGTMRPYETIPHSGSTLYVVTNYVQYGRYGFQVTCESDMQMDFSSYDRDDRVSWHALGSTSHIEYTKGTYIDTVEADPGTYPDDGIQGDYWYVKVE